MKTMLLVDCCGIIMLTFSHTKAEPDSTKQKNMALSGIDTSGFKIAIQPILQKNCSPCHFTGGKMHAKMPFDKGETIINHSSGILKRFSDKKEENALLKQFIEESKRH